MISIKMILSLLDADKQVFIHGLQMHRDKMCAKNGNKPTPKFRLDRQLILTQRILGSVSKMN